MRAKLTQGECVPTSMAIRQRCRPPNSFLRPVRVVATLPSSTCLPRPSMPIKVLCSSARSRPTQLALLGLETVLFFFTPVSSLGLEPAFAAQFTCDCVRNRPSHPISGQALTLAHLWERELEPPF